MSSISRICSVDGCLKPHIARSWCQMHYRRYKIHGSLDKPQSIKKKTHGLTNTPEYAAWRAMKHRCNNPNNQFYNRYGGRGITVCKQWNAKDGFLKFLEDMGSRPSSAHTLDREENDKGYSPDNCRWVTWDVQSLNKTHTMRSKSGYRGVFLRPHYKDIWLAVISVNGHHFNLGKFTDPESAAIEYDKAAIFFRGKYAITNIL